MSELATFILGVVAAFLIGGVWLHLQRRNRKSSAPEAIHRVSDVMNIAGDLIPDLDPNTEALLELGKSERVMVLSGTEGGRARVPYAITNIRIQFDNERDLRNCVRMLRWSDDRLRQRPEQMILWDWSRTFREKMYVFFGVAWYDREFFEKRKDAFKEPAHVAYYTQFGATPERFELSHEILPAQP